MEGFEPRIVVSDDIDAEIVFAALVDYQMRILGEMRLMKCAEPEVLKAARRAGDMAIVIGEEIQSRNIAQLTGGIPDDLSGIDGENQE